MPNPSTPQEFYEYYRYPSDAQLIEATNKLVAGYDRYVQRMALARWKPLSINEWTKAVIELWEAPE